MFEDIEKRLQKLRGEETDKKEMVPEVTKTNTFEQSLRKKIKEGGIIEVFEREDGTLRMHSVQIMDKWFFLSLCANAILFVLLLTNILGVW